MDILGDHTNDDPKPVGITVSDVLEQADRRALRAVNDDADLQRPVRQVLLCDPDDPLPPLSGSVALLPGQRTRIEQLPHIITQALRLGYACIIVKLDAAVVSQALASVEPSYRALPVLCAPDFVSWTDLNVLVSSVIASGGLSPSPITPMTRMHPNAGPGRGVEASERTLHAVCNSLASAFGGSVVVESLEQHILAYSSVPGQLIDPSREQTILARQVPDLPYHREQYLGVLMSRRPIYMQARNGEMARVAISIRSGKMPIGTIWAITAYDELSDEQAEAISEAARIVALTMLRASPTGEIEAQMRSGLFAEALQSQSIPVSLRHELSLGAQEALCCAALSLTHTNSHTSIEQVSIEVRRYLSAYSPRSISTLHGDKIYVLTTDATQASRRVIDAMITQLDKLTGAALVAGIAQLPTGLSSLTEARKQADLIVEVVRKNRATPGGSPTASLDDVHLAVLLSQLSDVQAAQPYLTHPLLAEIRAHDTEHGTDYEASIETFFRSLFDVTRAATSLRIHPNSLRYRLGRVEALFGISLRHTDTVLALWIQLEADRWGRDDAPPLGGRLDHTR